MSYCDARGWIQENGTGACVIQPAPWPTQPEPPWRNQPTIEWGYASVKSLQDFTTEGLIAELRRRKYELRLLDGVQLPEEGDHAASD